MGTWLIQIEGTGPHHNSEYSGDADKLAQSFVQTLKDRGHVISRAEMTLTGQTQDMQTGEFLTK